MDEWVKGGLQIVVSVLASLGAFYLTRQLFGPRLKIVAHEPDYGCFQTRELRFPADTIAHRPLGPDAQPIIQKRAPAIYADAGYVRIGVKNVGKGSALKCRGYLVGVELERDHRGRFFDALALVWSYQEANATLDIPPGITAHLDVLTASKGDDGDNLIPRLASIPTRYDELFF